MTCAVEINMPCSNGHPRSAKCSDPLPASCRRCDREAKVAKEKFEREAEQKRRQEAEQQRHLERMDALDAQIAAIRQAKEDMLRSESLANAVKQKEADIAEMLAHPQVRPDVVAVPSSATSSPTGGGVIQSALSFLGLGQSQVQPQTGLQVEEQRVQSGRTEQGVIQMDANMDGRDSPSGQLPTTPTIDGKSLEPTIPTIPPRTFPQLAPSPSSLEWERQKQFNGMVNTSIDAIMGMTSLEDVKKQVLQVLAKIEATTRQNASLAKERFNVVLLGNPGTGKPYNLILGLVLLPKSVLIMTNRQNHNCAPLRRLLGIYESHTGKSLHRDHRLEDGKPGCRWGEEACRRGAEIWRRRDLCR